MTLITSPVATAVLDCAMQVHRTLGPGMFESVYDRCIAHELTKAGLSFVRQFPVPVIYDGIEVGIGFRADFIVEREVLVDIKSVERLLPVHHTQVLTYLRCCGLKKGFLINFNTPLLKTGIKSVVL
jgi:GxxExxY protein